MTTFGQPKPLASLSSTLLARKGQARPAMRPQGFGGFGAMPGGHDDLGWNDMGHPEGHGTEPAYEPPPVYEPQPSVPPVLRQREALHEEFEAPQSVNRPRAIDLGASYDAEPAYEPEEAHEPEAYEPQAPVPQSALPQVAVPQAYEPEDAFEAAYASQTIYEAELEEEEEPEPEYQPASLLAVRTPKPAPAPEPVASAPEVPAPVVLKPVAPVPVARPVVSPATAARIGREAQAKIGKAAFTLRLDQDRHLRLRLASALHNCSAQVLVTQALDSFLQSLPEVEELARQLPSRATR
jgi:hypothetical protein